MIEPAVPVAQTSAVLAGGIIAALGGFISPFVMAWLTNRNARRMKIDDYARQDEIAKRLSERQDAAEDKAAEVAKQAAEAARLLVESNRKQENIAKIQGAKLDQIHTLGNSNLTAAMQNELDARRATVVVLKRLPNPSKEETSEIEGNQAKMAELDAQLRDRKKQTETAAQQLAVDLARKP